MLDSKSQTRTLLFLLDIFFLSPNQMDGMGRTGSGRFWVLYGNGGREGCGELRRSSSPA